MATLEEIRAMRAANRNKIKKVQTLGKLPGLLNNKKYTPAPPKITKDSKSPTFGPDLTDMENIFGSAADSEKQADSALTMSEHQPFKVWQKDDPWSKVGKTAVNLGAGILGTALNLPNTIGRGINYAAGKLGDPSISKEYMKKFEQDPFDPFHSPLRESGDPNGQQEQINKFLDTGPGMGVEMGYNMLMDPLSYLGAGGVYSAVRSAKYTKNALAGAVKGFIGGGAINSPKVAEKAALAYWREVAKVNPAYKAGIKLASQGTKAAIKAKKYSDEATAITQKALKKLGGNEMPAVENKVPAIMRPVANATDTVAPAVNPAVNNAEDFIPGMNGTVRNMADTTPIAPAVNTQPKVAAKLSDATKAQLTKIANESTDIGDFHARISSTITDDASKSEIEAYVLTSKKGLSGIYESAKGKTPKVAGKPTVGANTGPVVDSGTVPAAPAVERVMSKNTLERGDALRLNKFAREAGSIDIFKKKLAKLDSKHPIMQYLKSAKRKPEDIFDYVRKNTLDKTKPSTVIGPEDVVIKAPEALKTSKPPAEQTFASFAEKTAPGSSTTSGVGDKNIGQHKYGGGKFLAPDTGTTGSTANTGKAPRGRPPGSPNRLKEDTAANKQAARGMFSNLGSEEGVKNAEEALKNTKKVAGPSKIKKVNASFHKGMTVKQIDIPKNERVRLGILDENVKDWKGKYFEMKSRGKTEYFNQATEYIRVDWTNPLYETHIKPYRFNNPVNFVEASQGDDFKKLLDKGYTYEMKIGIKNGVEEQVKKTADASANMNSGIIKNRVADIPVEKPKVLTSTTQANINNAARKMSTAVTEQNVKATKRNVAFVVRDSFANKSAEEAAGIRQNLMVMKNKAVLSGNSNEFIKAVNEAKGFNEFFSEHNIDPANFYNAYKNSKPVAVEITFKVPKSDKFPSGKRSMAFANKTEVNDYFIANPNELDNFISENLTTPIPTKTISHDIKVATAPVFNSKDTVGLLKANKKLIFDVNLYPSASDSDRIKILKRNNILDFDSIYAAFKSKWPDKDPRVVFIEMADKGRINLTKLGERLTKKLDGILYETPPGSKTVTSKSVIPEANQFYKMNGKWVASDKQLTIGKGPAVKPITEIKLPNAANPGGVSDLQRYKQKNFAGTYWSPEALTTKNGEQYMRIPGVDSKLYKGKSVTDMPVYGNKPNFKTTYTPTGKTKVVSRYNAAKKRMEKVPVPISKPAREQIETAKYRLQQRVPMLDKSGETIKDAQGRVRYMLGKEIDINDYNTYVEMVNQKYVNKSGLGAFKYKDITPGAGKGAEGVPLPQWRLKHNETGLETYANSQAEYNTMLSRKTSAVVDGKKTLVPSYTGFAGDRTDKRFIRAQQRLGNMKSDSSLTDILSKKATDLTDEDFNTVDKFKLNDVTKRILNVSKDARVESSVMDIPNAYIDPKDLEKVGSRLLAESQYNVSQAKSFVELPESVQDQMRVAVRAFADKGDVKSIAEIIKNVHDLPEYMNKTIKQAMRINNNRVVAKTSTLFNRIFDSGKATVVQRELLKKLSLKTSFLDEVVDGLKAKNPTKFASLTGEDLATTIRKAREKVITKTKVGRRKVTTLSEPDIILKPGSASTIKGTNVDTAINNTIDGFAETNRINSKYGIAFNKKDLKTYKYSNNGLLKKKVAESTSKFDNRLNYSGGHPDEFGPAPRRQAEPNYAVSGGGGGGSKTPGLVNPDTLSTRQPKGKKALGVDDAMYERKAVKAENARAAADVVTANMKRKLSASNIESYLRNGYRKDPNAPADVNAYLETLRLSKKPAEAARIEKFIDETLSLQGQSIKLSEPPPGTVSSHIKGLKKALADYNSRMKDATKVLKLPEKDWADISDALADAVKIPQDTYEGRLAVERAKKMLLDRLPASEFERFKAAQQLSLLLNLKTPFTNLTGNAVVDVVENTVTERLAKFLNKHFGDKLTGNDTGIDIFGGPKVSTRLAGAKEGFTNATRDLVGGKSKLDYKGMKPGEFVKQVWEDISDSISTRSDSGRYELNRGLAFRDATPSKAVNKGLMRAEGVKNFTLTAGDAVFKDGNKKAIKEAIINANKGYDTEFIDSLSDMIADEVARRRTFQDSNSFEEGIRNLKVALNNTVGKYVAQGVIPFPKTPANILKRTFEYGPLGLLEGLYKARQSRKLFNSAKSLPDIPANAFMKDKTLKDALLMQRKAADVFASGVVGTGVIGAGMYGMSQGAITGKPSTNKNQAALDKAMGKQPYSIKVGNKYIAYDKLPPMGAVIAMGADSFGAKNPIEGFSTGLGTVFNQSFLQGVSQLMGANFNNQNNIVQNLQDIVANMPTQFVPTLGKQVAQLLDNTQRETYDPNKIKELGMKIMAKIPGVSQLLPAKVDTLGNVVKSEKLNNIVPTNITTAYSTKITSEINKLKKYNNGVIPMAVDRTVEIDGKSVALTGEQFNDYQKILSDSIMQIYGEIMKSPEYTSRAVTDKQRAAMLVNGIHTPKTDLPGKSDISKAVLEILQGMLSNRSIGLGKTHRLRDAITKASGSI